MADDNQDTTANDDSAQVAADQRLNAVVKSHLRRELKALREEFSKSVETAVAASIAKTQEAKPSESGGRGSDGKFTAGEKVDPQVKITMDRLAAMERELKEERDRRLATEAREKKNANRQSMRETLDSLGIKGSRANAVIAMFEADRMREGEDGVTRFVSSRSREKGRPAEELEYDDLAAGIMDWSKSQEAADFLPAPTAPTSSSRQQPGRQVGQQKPQKYDRAPRSPEEAIRRTIEQLQAQGVDPVAALKNE